MLFEELPFWGLKKGLWKVREDGVEQLLPGDKFRSGVVCDALPFRGRKLGVWKESEDGVEQVLPCEIVDRSVNRYTALLLSQVGCM